MFLCHLADQHGEGHERLYVSQQRCLPGHCVVFLGKTHYFYSGYTKEYIWEWEFCNRLPPGGSSCLLSLGWIRMLVFCWREENRRTPRKPSEQGRKLTANTTLMWSQVWESNSSHSCKWRALSPLHHPCYLWRWSKVELLGKSEEMSYSRSRLVFNHHWGIALPFCWYQR